MYPSSASQFRRVGDHRMHYLDQGTGPVILCVHGNPTWSFYYREIFHHFSSTHRVIAVDHIGCGLSDKPARNRFAYTLAAHRDNLISLIDELNFNEVTLLAHDWGGAIGLSAAVERVDRMAGVVLLNTAAFVPPYMPKRIGVLRTPLLGTFAIRGMNAFAGPAVTMAMSKHRLSKEVAAGLLHPYRSWKDRVAIDSFVRDIPMSPTHQTYASPPSQAIDLGHEGLVLPTGMFRSFHLTLARREGRAFGGCWALCYGGCTGGNGRGHATFF
jgi:cis-3-alkyl-4-acyloxetan-2-one decarboxylase